MTTSNQVTLRKALRILCAFTMERPYLSISEISTLTGYPYSTVHRFVSILAREGFLALDERHQPGRYKLGLRLFELGSVVRETFDLRRASLDILETLARKTNETVHLVVRDGNAGIYLEKVELPGKTVHYSRVGKKLPLHCTASGKALLSGLPDAEVRALLGETLPRYTPNTITTIEELLAELQRVREQGWAMDAEELEVGLSCLGAPIRDFSGGVVAAISLSGVAVSFNGERRPTLIKALVDAANLVSSRLGYRVKDASQEVGFGGNGMVG